MADRFPLILNTSNNQIQEIASGDNLDLTGSGINNAGIITAGNVTIGAATTDLVVNGDARITGILTIGTSSLKLDGPNNLVNVGTALTLGHTQGLQFHTQNLHSAGFEVNQVNASGIITATGADINGDLDVDGHTNLDNVNVVGVVTVTGAVNASHSNFGNVTALGLVLSNTNATILFTDTNADPDYSLGADGGVLKIRDTTNNADRLVVNTDGHIDINGNLDCLAGLDVTGNATVSGNLSVGGVLTYEDVTNVDSVGIVTAREGVFLPDLKQLKIGNTAAAPDLYLWHNSSTGNSNISNKTGDLFIQGNDGSGTVVNQIAVKSNAAVELNYQGTKRFETTGSGVNISGNLITNHSNGAIVNNGWGFLRQRFDTANYDSIKWQNAAASVDFCDIGYDIDTSTSPDSGILRLKGVGSKGRVLIIAGSVTIQFNEEREISGVGDILPATDSQYNIGSNSLRFANIYADTLYGDGSNLTGIASPAITAINSASNNRIVTSDGGTTVTAESNLTFDGSRLTTQAVTINDNGVSGIIFDVRTDDQSPWMLHFGNDTYSTDGGLYAYQSNGGAFEFRARGNNEYIHLDFNRWNGSTNQNWLRLNSNGAVELSNSGSTKLATIGTGIEIYGGSADWSETNPGPTKGSIHLDPNDTTNHFGSAITFGASDHDNGQSAQAGIYTRTDGSYGSQMYFATTSSYSAGSYARFMIDYNGHVLPTVNGNYDLGASGKRWRNVYTTDLQLSNEGKTNDVDGTWGNYTIQEGESDLFLINNRSGKKYKFNLTEVS